MKRSLDIAVQTTASRTLFKSLMVVIGSSLAVSACSKVPDAINPAAWYRSTTDVAADEGTKDEAPVPGADAGSQEDLDVRSLSGEIRPGALAAHVFRGEDEGMRVKR